jgi:transposase InsO family protein
MADDTDARIDVAVACRVLGVSRSGYYDWLGRPPSLRQEENTLLGKLIEKIHDDSRKTYGWPRVHAELVLGLGMPVNHKRVARLMREAGIQGLYRRRNRRGSTGPATEDDLVHRQFAVDAPDRLWLTDITEHPTAEGTSDGLIARTALAVAHTTGLAAGLRGLDSHSSGVTACRGGLVVELAGVQQRSRAACRRR